MRFRITLVPVNDVQQVIIPLDFRRHFISLVKTMLKDSPFFSRFDLDKPGYSPYVFAVNFSKILSIDGKKQELLVRPPVYMTISTGVYGVMTALCNGAIQLKGHETVLGLKVFDINMLPLIKINASQVLFKIQGHAVLRGPGGYLNPDECTTEELEEAINTHLIMHSTFLNDTYQNLDGKLEQVKIIPAVTNIYKGVCSHYGGTLTTCRNILGLQGKPESLQFIYDYGMGVRTGQGFGLLEVVRER